MQFIYPIDDSIQSFFKGLQGIDATTIWFITKVQKIIYMITVSL